MEKKCKKCNVVKDVSEFYNDNSRKDGLTYLCKSCKKERWKNNKENIKVKQKQYYEANKEKVKEKRKQYYEANKEKTKEKRKQYNEANKESINERQSQYNKANKEKIQVYRKQYIGANKEKIKEGGKKWREENKEWVKDYREVNKEYLSKKRKQYYKANKKKLNNYNISYAKSRRKVDSLFKLKDQYRKASHRYLKDGKSKTTREIIGIDYKEFQDYLEVEYTKGMHLDHIIPLSWANIDEEVYILNHYSNFQILTAEENLAKSDSYCKSENLKKVLDNHNDLIKLNKIIERNSDKIK
jgi:hypothetical protein